MRVLITGGNGFIGSYLQKEFDNSVIFDNFKNSEYPTHKCNEIYDIDLSEKSYIFENQVAFSDIVVHLASSVGVKNLNENPVDFLWNMYKINRNVIEICKKYNKKIIFLSSSEVYGNGLNLKETDDFKLLNNQRSLYAIEKLNSEFLIQNSGIEYLIIRPFNITGFGQNPNNQVLPNFCKNAKLGKDLEVYNSVASRSFCSIRDFTRILKILIENEITGIYNIGNPKNYISIYELAKLCKSELNTTRNSPIIFKKFSYEYKNLLDIDKRSPNIDKLLNLGKELKIDLEPKISLKEIINEFK